MARKKREEGEGGGTRRPEGGRREEEGGTRGEQEGAGQLRDVAPQQAVTRRPHYRSHWFNTKKLAERKPSMNAEGREKEGGRRGEQGSRTAAERRAAVGRHGAAALQEPLAQHQEVRRAEALDERRGKREGMRKKRGTREPDSRGTTRRSRPPRDGRNTGATDTIPKKLAERRPSMNAEDKKIISAKSRGPNGKRTLRPVARVGTGTARERTRRPRTSCKARARS